MYSYAVHSYAVYSYAVYSYTEYCGHCSLLPRVDPKDADKSDDVIDPLPLVTYRKAYYVVMAIKEFLLFSCRLSGSESTCNLLGHLEKSYLIDINSCT